MDTEDIYVCKKCHVMFDEADEDVPCPVCGNKSDEPEFPEGGRYYFEGAWFDVREIIMGYRE